MQEIRNVVLAVADPTINRPYSEVGDDIRRIGDRYKLPLEGVGYATLAAIDELSRTEPMALPMHECLCRLCENVLGDPDAISVLLLAHRCRQVLLDVSLSHTLWRIMHGQDVDSVFKTPCGFVLQPDEKRLSDFGTVLYRKSVTVSSHVGGYNGAAVRVASGIYYRFGGYSGQTSPEQLQNIDNGFFALTKKAMYFGGQQQTFRVPYTSVLRFKAYPDGLGFFRNLGDGREESFMVVDVCETMGVRNADQIPRGTLYDPARAVGLPVGWFLYNAVTFLTTRNQAP